MGYRPPKGVRPPQLEGKRTGRPKGSKNYAGVWADIRWAYNHQSDRHVSAPSLSALFWWRLAATFPEEFAFWVERGGRAVDAQDFYDGYD